MNFVPITSPEQLRAGALLAYEEGTSYAYYKVVERRYGEFALLNLNSTAQFLASYRTIKDNLYVYNKNIMKNVNIYDEASSGIRR